MFAQIPDEDGFAVLSYGQRHGRITGEGWRPTYFHTDRRARVLRWRATLTLLSKARCELVMRLPAHQTCDTGRMSARLHASFAGGHDGGRWTGLRRLSAQAWCWTPVEALFFPPRQELKRSCRKGLLA